VILDRVSGIRPREVSGNVPEFWEIDKEPSDDSI